jgi:uncharacterized protein
MYEIDNHLSIVRWCEGYGEFGRTIVTESGNILRSTVMGITTESTVERIASRAECDELMVKYSMLPNIIEHSIQVMNVSLAIVDNLRSDVRLNRDLIIAAALLHDITKTKSLKTKEPHDVSGGSLLRELGFPGTAEIVEQHVFIRNLNLEGMPEEREIVYYADKRVLHDTIVTVEERVDDLIRRYGTTGEICSRILQSKVSMLALERKIAGFMEIDLSHALREQQSRRTGRQEQQVGK